jgi:uncharacterized protein YccT (UPF0319 family)
VWALASSSINQGFDWNEASRPTKNIVFRVIRTMTNYSDILCGISSAIILPFYCHSMRQSF